MHKKRMANFLPEKTADYRYVLDIAPQNVLPERGEKKQLRREFDDGNESVITLSSVSQFTVTVQWDILGQEDASYILDLWHDTAKANGMENTFYWKHPVEENLYVVRFIDSLARVDAARKPSYKEVEQIKLKVLGVVIIYILDESASEINDEQGYPLYAEYKNIKQEAI